MRYSLYTVTLVVLVLVMFSACDSYVEDVEDPIDNIADDELNQASQVPFLISGVQGRFATTHDQITVLAGGLSDELFFDQNVPNATFPTFAQIDEGVIQLDNNSVDGAYGSLGEYRFLADRLLERVAAIDAKAPGEGGFEEGEDDAALRNEALYTGYLHGGIARFFYAAYFGLNPREGGGVISNIENPISRMRGRFIPSDEMYQLAIQKLDSALQFTEADSYEARLVNSIAARIHLYQDNYDLAQDRAESGLVEDDAPLESLHSVQLENFWYTQAGVGRTQYVADFRFADYVAENPQEATRIPLEDVEGNDGTIYVRQGLYPERPSPIVFISWQENSLMLAEVALRSGDAATAFPLVNSVRASHSLSPLASIDLDGLVVERDRELFTQGARLVDERRFDLWHLGPDTWQYLPITQSERNDNPCLTNPDNPNCQ